MGGGTVIEIVFKGGGKLWQEMAVTLLLCVFFKWINELNTG
jgi:hypothetical protein